MNSDVLTKHDFLISLCDSATDIRNLWINIFSLACFRNNLNIVQLIARKVNGITCYTFVNIICHPKVKVEIVKYLVNQAKFHFNPVNWHKYPKNKIMFRILQILTYECLENVDKNDACFQKLKAVLGVIKQSTRKDKSSFDVLEYLSELSIKYKDSRVLQDILDNSHILSAESLDNFYSNLLKNAIQRKAYYIVHILVTKYRVKGRLYVDTFKTNDSLFLLHHFLMTGSNPTDIFGDISLYIRGTSLYDARNCVYLWLLCCYMKCDIHSVSLSSVITGRNQTEIHTRTICSILLESRTYSDIRVPLYYAVELGFASVVSLLISYGCDMNNMIELYQQCPTTVAIKQGYYNILKILLLCGADTSVPSLRDLSNLPQHPDGHFEDDRLFLVQWLQQPRSLKHFCRKTIRQFYGSKLPSALKKIRYPEYLKNYIRGKHLL